MISRAMIVDTGSLKSMPQYATISGPWVYTRTALGQMTWFCEGRSCKTIKLSVYIYIYIGIHICIYLGANNALAILARFTFP